MAFVIANSCIACGDCLNACPEGSAIVVGDIYAIDPAACIACGICVDACLTSSIFEQKSALPGAPNGGENRNQANLLNE